MTPGEYFAAPGVSNSMLRELEWSPAHLQAYLAKPREKTLALEIGTFFHDLILLDRTPQNLAIRPDGMDFRKADGKAWRAEQEAAGRAILKREEYDSIFGMRDSIMRNPVLRAAVESGDPELSLFAPFESEAGEVLRKGRLDLVTRGAAILDFKTTTDARLSSFAKTIAEMRYYRQAAYYLDVAAANGMPHKEFVFVAIEKEAPFACSVFHLDRDAIDKGRAENEALLDVYIRCRDSGEWPAYNPEPQLISLPAWAMKQGIAA